jgi:hypothetical protein
MQNQDIRSAVRKARRVIVTITMAHDVQYVQATKASVLALFKGGPTTESGFYYTQNEDVGSSEYQELYLHVEL